MSNTLLSIAPMIDWSHTHFRAFMRMLAPYALLYTEMQTLGAILHKPEKTLAFNPREHPLALQLGGALPKLLAECAKQAEQVGFDEINLNLGCPSDKVQAGQFGACLMAHPTLVEHCIRAMKQAVSIPVTAKIRIGIDEQDSYAFFSDFAGMLALSGVDKIIVHARKAWLQGLSPKQNRTIPPVHYSYVYDLKKELPHMCIVINGDIKDLNAINCHLQRVDGVMLGRLACDNPYALAGIHKGLYPEKKLLTRKELLQNYLDYAITKHIQGESLSLLFKPIMNLPHGLPGASSWKQKVMGLIAQKKVSCFQSIFDTFP